MPAGQLNLVGWRALTASYPERRLVETILGICQFGAKIGYEGTRSTIQIHSNLSGAEDLPEIIAADIAAEPEKNRLQYYPSQSSLPDYYIASPLGLTDKSDSSKRRIHHLSYPTNTERSINAGIPELYGNIKYSSIEDATTGVSKLGQGCYLIKRDFENALRHIPICPEDSPLLGFHWENRYYSEQFLPFGLRTAPYIFNLYAEMFQWILVEDLNPGGDCVETVHYVDDFLMIVPPGVNPAAYSKRFQTLSEVVGLASKELKNEEGRVATFGGIELDTGRMVIRLPEKKLKNARNVIQNAIQATSLSLTELQKITGYLNFVATVVPLGRTFLRRLYNMQLYFPSQSHRQRRRISSEAHKDLASWLRVLKIEPVRSILTQRRQIVTMWSAASGSKGLGAYYILGGDKEPRVRNPQSAVALAHNPMPGMAFSISLPRYITHTCEHINTKEMRAVEQALLHWGKKWQGRKVIVHTHNRAVAYGIANRTNRGGSMVVLRRCLLLAAEHDIEVETEWISTTDNALADALSRFNFEKVADLAPQLLHPTSSLRDLGFLTYRRRASQL